MQITTEGLTQGIVERLVAKGYSVEIDADTGYAEITRNMEPKNEAVASEAVS